MKQQNQESISNHIDVIFNHLHFGLSILAFLSIPLFSFLFGLKGFIASFILNLIVLPFTLIGLKHRKHLDAKQFHLSIKNVLSFKLIFFTSLALLNCYLIYKITLNTLIPISYILLLFIVTSRITFFFIYLLNWKYKFLISFLIIPSCINLFFTLNFVFSKQPIVEQYRFKQEKQVVEGSTQNTSLIILENDHYDEYLGIRFFMDYQELENKQSIRYTFKDGLFGYRVVTAIELIP